MHDLFYGILWSVMAITMTAIMEQFTDTLAKLWPITLAGPAIILALAVAAATVRCKLLTWLCRLPAMLWALRPVTVLQDHSVGFAIAVVAGLVVLSWFRGDPPLALAAVAGLLIAAAMVLAFRFVQAVEKEPVVLRSIWGGLGDGGGGLELTKPGALLLLALAFAVLALWAIVDSDARRGAAAAGASGTITEKSEKR